jgi:hypothetical protein
MPASQPPGPNLDWCARLAAAILAGHEAVAAAAVTGPGAGAVTTRDGAACTLAAGPADPEPAGGAPWWVRVEDEHPRWEISNPAGDGHDYLCTDALIRAYGRGHVERVILHGLPPLPECAWAAGALPRSGGAVTRLAAGVLAGHPAIGSAAITGPGRIAVTTHDGVPFTLAAAQPPGA